MSELWALLPSGGWQRFAIDALWQSTLLAGLALVVMRLVALRPALRAAMALAALAMCVAAPLTSALARYQGWGMLAIAQPAHAVEIAGPRSAPTVQIVDAPSNFAARFQPAQAPRIDKTWWTWRLAGGAWLLMSSLLAVRLVRSARSVHRLCRDALDCADPELCLALVHCAEKMGVPPPQLLLSSQVDTPALVTWGRPRLLLPAALEVRPDWTAIFTHELAHLARRDGISRWTVEVVTIALPWQPLVWVLRRDFRAACEEACDDWAVAAGVDPVDFAELLLDFVPQAQPALALGMSESVAAARGRIVRLLAMQEVPRPKLGKLLGASGWLVAAVLACLLALLQYGRLPWGDGSDLPPWGNAPIQPVEALSASTSPRPALPTYRVDAPDILLIDIVKLVPKSPYRIEKLDSLEISSVGVLPEQPLEGRFSVDPAGALNLGPMYGKVAVAGMTLDEAHDAIVTHLSEILTAPEISVALGEIAGQQHIAGEHLVGPDGMVTLGVYGSVNVAGKTLQECRTAIESHLGMYLDNPQVSVDVFAYNSKVYYIVLTNSTYGDNVWRIPITGNESLFDALTHLRPQWHLTSESWVFVARPASPDGKTAAQTLPVDWRALSRGESTATNYWILPGDRIFIGGRVDYVGSPPAARTQAPSSQL